MTKSTTQRASTSAKTTDAAAAAAPRRSRKPKPTPDGNIPPDTTAAKATSKLGTVIALLSRPQGATIADMMAATGWQAHSVRGALAGAIKKKRGHDVTSEVAEAGRFYRIVPAEAQ